MSHLRLLDDLQVSQNTKEGRREGGRKGRREGGREGEKNGRREGNIEEIHNKNRKQMKIKINIQNNN